MNYLFYLDDLEIEEPIGFRDIELSIKRDSKLHGITFEASTTTLGFYGAAATYLKKKKEESGIKASVILQVLATCDTYDYEEILSGRLNFGKYKESCGDTCIVSLPWEEDSCQVVMRSRWELKIDMDKETAVDGITALEPYTGLAVETELPTHVLDARVEGYVSQDGDQTIIEPNCITNEFIWVRPTYADERFNSINQGNLIPFNFFQYGHDNAQRITPQLLFDDQVGCFSGEFDYEVRMKGSFQVNQASLGASPAGARVQIRLMGPDDTSMYCDDSNIFDYSCIIAQAEIATGNSSIQDWDISFDETFTGTIEIPDGYGFYAYLYFPFGFSCGNDLTVTFDPETYIKISAPKSCPATNADLYLIHETLSRITESITNGCMRVKSEYYGRTDSEPYSFDTDGCGGLRSLTSGLKIRNAEEDKYYLSLKDAIEGLNGIDNIGIGVEPDPIFSTALILRVEDVAYFYQDNEILRHAYVPEADTVIEENGHYAKVNVGYKKWEVERINGLDEFNSNREYSTSLDTITNSLDIQRNFVAGSYPIEVTRQQSFAETGGADTRYDNDTFIIQMKREEYPYGNISVKQGGITSAENIFSPDTIYNFDLSPARNLMRWYKTIAAGFAAVGDSLNQLFFQSGTGNLLAKGLLTDDTCRQEGVVIQENQNIFTTHFADADDYTPIWVPELITYEYDMSLAEYKKIKAAPYGYISVQCGTGDYVKYWIVEIKYKLAKGKATFQLRRKYGL
jgi:hypothetical protein